MFDLLMLGLGAVAFATCAGYVTWCDRIIGPDPQNTTLDEISVDNMPTDHMPADPIPGDHRSAAPRNAVMS